ncbi:MAG: M56 family metallopeptidase [Gemmatimonadota bacterium]
MTALNATPLADPFTSALATHPSALPALLMIVKITCLLLAALGASRILHRASAGSRHLVWLIALAALLVLPPLAAWSPLPLRVLPESLTQYAAAPASVGAALETGNATGTVQPENSIPADLSIPSAPETGVMSLSTGTLLLGAWGIVACVLLAQLAYGAWSVRRIVRRARPLADADWQTPLFDIADRLELESAPRLLRSEDVKMPFACGLLTPTIVLPAESDEWSAERRTAVLIHELGHIRRHDLVGHTLGRLACAFYWFHPLVWTAARRLRAESERACDDLALVFGARPSDYAEHLLEIVTCVRDHYTPAVALAMAHRKEFEGRMLAILNPELRRGAPSRLETASLVSGLAVLALFIGAASPVRRAPVTTTAIPASQPEIRKLASGDTAEHVSVPLRLRVESPAAPKPSATPRPSAQPVAMPDSAAQTDDERVAVLAKALRTDSSSKVRRVAAWGLNRYADSEIAQQALVSALGGDADATVREMAAWALARARGNAAAGAALVKALRQDHDPKVRATAVWSLGSIRDESAVEALTSVLADTDPGIRQTAAWAIGTIHPDQAPAQLINALSDKDRDVRLSVAWALYNIRDDQAVNALDAAFRHETDSDVQHGIIRALGAMGERSVEALQRLVSSPDPEIREGAVTALAGGNASGPWPWPRPEPRPFP